MKRSGHAWLYPGIALLAGVAATAAYAYEQADQSPRAIVLESAQEDNPGIDFMITGQAGPSKRTANASDINPSSERDEPVRRRMRLN
jgi:hypothetical protein